MVPIATCNSPVKSLHSCSEVCTHVGGIELQQLIVGVGVTLTRVCVVTTPMHSQLHIIWREQAQLSCVDERVTVADAGSTVSRLSAFTASSGQGLQHVQNCLQLRAVKIKLAQGRTGLFSSRNPSQCQGSEVGSPNIRLRAISSIRLQLHPRLRSDSDH